MISSTPNETGADAIRIPGSGRAGGHGVTNGNRGSGAIVGHSGLDPGEVGIVGVGHRPTVAGQGVQEVGVIALRGRERVVALVDDDEVPVPDRQEGIPRSVPVIDALDGPTLRSSQLIEVGLLEDGLARRVVHVVLVGRPAGPVAGRGEHLADQQPVRREARHHDVVDLAGGIPGAADLDLDVVRADEDRLGRDAGSAGRRCLGHGHHGALAGQRPADDPGRRPGRDVGAPGHPLEDRGRPVSRSVGASIERDLDAAAGDRDDRRLLVRTVEDDGLALVEPERPERQVAPAGPGRVRRDDAGGIGPDVELVGRQAHRQLGGVDHRLRGGGPAALRQRT